MNINEFLQTLEQSPIDVIQEKLLMQDNFPIVFGGRLSILLEARSFQEQFLQTSSSEGYFQFQHWTGSRAQAFGWVGASLPDEFPNINFSPYNATISLHLSSAESEPRGFHYLISGREMLKDIVRVAQHQRMPFCLPFTTNLITTKGLVSYTP